MADPSESGVCQLENSESGVFASWVGASSSSEFASLATSASEGPTTTCMTTFLSACSDSLSSEKEAEIERSKMHWSNLVEFEHGVDEVAEESNVKVFKAVQRHPTWGDFFRTFGDGGVYDCGEMEVLEKFAEGSQGELYHVHVNASDPDYNLWNKEHGVMHVLKVYKRGTFMLNLLKEWPIHLFREYAKWKERTMEGKAQLSIFVSIIICGTLLQDGRFGFLMIRATEDLQTFIDRSMIARPSLDCGPFPVEIVAPVMYDVAKGVDWLHNLDIVHRDLKAANVLCSRVRDVNDIEAYMLKVADYECSSGVTGTGFFRAPEILQALKGRVLNSTPNLFTKSADVYSLGMLCYVILTGRRPFDGHRINDYDLVLNGQRPEVPDFVAEWARDLLRWCWESDPASRPTCGEILSVLEANSIPCEDYRRWLDEKHQRTAVSTADEVNELYPVPKYQHGSTSCDSSPFFFVK